MPETPAITEAVSSPSIAPATLSANHPNLSGFSASNFTLSSPSIAPATHSANHPNLSGFSASNFTISSPSIAPASHSANHANLSGFSDSHFSPQSTPAPTQPSTNFVSAPQFSQANIPPNAHVQPAPNIAYAPFMYPMQTTIKLPPFNVNDPSLWLIQVDDQYKLFNIQNENVKFTYTVSALPNDITAKIRDIITNKPPHLPYTALKKILLQRLTIGMEERIQRLLKDEQLGDQRPTQLLMRMKALANDCSTNIDDTILKTLFLRRLPPHVQEILTLSASTSTVEVLAESADKILSINKRVQVNAIQPVQSFYTHPDYSPMNNIPQHSTVQQQQPMQFLEHSGQTTPVINQTLEPNLMPNSYGYNPSANIQSQTYAQQTAPYTAQHATQYTQQPFPITHAVTQHKHPNTMQQQPTNSLDQRMSKLEEKIERLLVASDDRSRANFSKQAPQQPNRSKTPTRSNSRTSNFDRDGQCYYHSNYGTEARKCREGCIHYRNQGN